MTDSNFIINILKVCDDYDINKHINVIHDVRKNKDTLSSYRKYIDKGDEGKVYEVQSEMRKYALKIFDDDVYISETEDLIKNMIFLKDLGFGIIFHYVAIYDEICYIVMDLLDITLRDYLKLYPEKNRQYYDIVSNQLQKLSKFNLYDCDLKLDNIMLNLSEPNNLYWVDPHIIPIVDQFKYKYLINSLPKMFSL
jgi:hypothetical protein